MSKTTADLVPLLHQRGTVLAQIVESSTDPATLIEEASISRATVYRVLETFEEWGLITSDTDQFKPTLFGWLVLTVYDEFVADVTAMVDHEAGNMPLWHTADERTDALELVADRFDLLEYAQTPRDKRTLVAELSYARSTVDRVVRELELAGLIQRTADGYTTTPIGQQLTTRYRPLFATLTEILAARDLLASLPADCALPTALFATPTVERTAPAIPYHLLTGVRERLVTADHIRLVLPVLSTPQLLDMCHHRVVRGATLGLVADPALAETLTSEFPGPLAEMAAAATGSVSVSVADTPPFGLILAKTEASTTVSVVIYGVHGTIQGAIHTETDTAVQWAEECYAQISEGARDVTDTLSDLSPRRMESATRGSSVESDTDPALETEGIVQLTPEYFAQRAPAPPVTGWRTGFDLVDIHAGYVIDREREYDGTRHNLTTDLTTHLTENTNLAVLGPPGSGKSTVCKSVACRWYEQGLGPVFYRESGRGTTLASPAILENRLRTANGHALVVVEDAVRAEANAIFRVMQAFRGTETVTFLLDAREGEWVDPEAFPIDASLDAYRTDAVKTVTMPALDDTETKRFVQQFEQTTDTEIDDTTVQVRQERQREDVNTQSHATRKPAEVLLLLHRLSMHADPLAVYTTNTPTMLVEDVQRTYERLRQAGDRVLDVGVLVNLLNAAGLGVSPALICALADDDEETGLETIRAALSVLEGRVIFEREESMYTTSSSYRIIHEEWSRLFLDNLLESDTEHAASQRFGQCVTALLSLADEPAQRDRIMAAFGHTAPAIERIAAAPSEWADTTVERLFHLGRTRPGLAPLFGTTGESSIDLPDACSPTMTVECTLWRAIMARDAMTLDRAEYEYECLAALAADVEAMDPEWAATLRGKRLNGFGVVSYRRNALDTAETHFTRALDHYQEAGNTLQAARTRMNLGLVAQSRGNHETAEASLIQCLDTYREHGHRPLEAVALQYLSVFAAETGALETAIDYGEQAFEIFHEVGDRRHSADCLYNLGADLVHRGSLDTAASYCLEALEIYRDIGAHSLEACTLDAIGQIHRMQGDFDTAEKYHSRSLDILREIGDRRFEAWCLIGFGALARQRGDLNTATARCETSRKICQEIGERIGDGKNLTMLGELARRQGDLETAMEHATEALTLHHEIEDSRGAAVSHRLLGRIACDHERFTTAKDHLTQALTDFREMGYRYEEAETLAALGALARAQTNHPQARDRFKQAVALYREIGAIEDTIETTEQLAVICETMTELTAALAHCETAYDLAKETKFVEVPGSLDERRTHLAERLMTDSSE